MCKIAHSYSIMNTATVNYGIMLKLIREKLNWNQTRLANYLEIDRTVLSRYETGVSEFKLTPPQMVKILELLVMCGLSMFDALEYCKKN